MKRNTKFLRYYFGIFFLLCSGCTLFKSEPDKTRLFNIGFKREATELLTDDSSICLILNHFPEYLNSPQMTTKVGEHELKSHPRYRWATPLSENISYIIKQSVQQSFPKAQIYEFPKDTVGEVDITLKLDIDLLEINEVSHRVIFKGTWIILDKKRKLIDHFPFEFYEPFGEVSDYCAEVVAKIEQVVLSLGDAIAKRIHVLLSRKNQTV